MFRMGTIGCDTCMDMFMRTWTKPLVVVDVNNVLAAPHPRRLPSPGSPLEFPPQTLTCSATYLPHSTFKAAITTCAPLNSFLLHFHPPQHYHHGFQSGRKATFARGAVRTSTYSRRTPAECLQGATSLHASLVTINIWKMAQANHFRRHRLALLLHDLLHFHHRGRRLE
jgi:hypothetical protein